MAAARTGAPGAQGSVFVRGGESHFARVLVDGVPVNEPGGAFNFGDRAALSSCERIEVVRGAASSLYGTDALAGVIHLVTRQAGTGRGSRRARGGRGRQLLVVARGRRHLGQCGALRLERWAWPRLETDNEQPNNAFEQTAGAALRWARAWAAARPCG